MWKPGIGVALSSALITLLPAVLASAQQTLVADALTSSACGAPCGAGRTVAGGQDFDVDGWSPHADGDRVVYDLGTIAAAGALEFTVAHFAPFAQYQCSDNGEKYAEFVGISESDTCSHADGSYAYLMVIYAPGLDAECLPTDQAPNHASAMRGGLNLNCEWQDSNPTCYDDPTQERDHRFRVEWDRYEARIYSVESLTEPLVLVESIQFLAYPNECSCECEQPLISHICLGQTHSSPGWFDGPAFTDVVITKLADPDAQDCCSAGGGGAGAAGGSGGSGNAGGATGASGGSGGSATGGGGAGAAANANEESSGCDCRLAVGRREMSPAALLGPGLLGLAIASRRRRALAEGQ